MSHERTNWNRWKWPSTAGFLAFLLLCMSGAPAWSGGNGTSYTGPDLSGVSVGPAIEAKASMNRIRQITLDCTYEMAKSLWENYHQENFERAVQASADVMPNFSGGEMWMGSAEILTPAEIKAKRFNFSYSPNQCEVVGTLSRGPGDNELSIGFSRCSTDPVQVRLLAPGVDPAIAPVEMVPLVTKTPIPYYRLKSLAVEPSSYDSLGRFLPSKLNATTDFELIIPESADAPKARLLNAATGVATKLSLDVGTYVKCLRQGI